ncbi:MAG: lipopolysaccharide transport periplasmic protein LptA [Pseudomonadales bacterium]|nr:lipopolysaccharide transport periplasmic protein LptA [Pseudomonadales bacterium]
MKHIQICLFLFIFWPSLGFSLNSDREQNIQIQADAAIVDDNTGITIYSGNVTIDQGTLHISADEVKVIMNEKEVLQVIASMEPKSSNLAHYEQQPEEDEALVSADAKVITYFLQEERLHLVGRALLRQTNDVFSGELLHYDLAKGIVDLRGGGKKSDGRVHITLTPKPK